MKAVGPGLGVLLLLTLVVLGCGEAPPVPICDGTDRVRLAAFVSGGGPSALTLTPEVGYSFLYVDGSCRYVVNLGGWLEATRGGVLDAASAAALSASVSYGRWPELAGNYAQPAFDAAGLTFDSGRLDRPDITCVLCEGVSEDIDGVVRGYEQQAATLQSAGQDLAGPVRFIVWDGRPEPYPSIDASSSPIDFQALVVPLGTSNPTANQTGSAEEAAFLRALRAATLVDPVSRNTRAAYLTVRDGEDRIFWLEIRDVLPMEGPDHQVHLR